MTANTRTNLFVAADAIIDLVDGLGGDAQEQDRGNQIARLLRDTANGGDGSGWALLDHETARAAWAAQAQDAPSSTTKVQQAYAHWQDLAQDVEQLRRRLGVLADDVDQRRNDAGMAFERYAELLHQVHGA